jgi:uncharacterized protein YbaR (Trm112 family)
MALSDELKAVLACPKCKGEVVFPEGRAEIHCERCQLAYRIEDDVPVMLVEEARPLDALR